MIDLLAHLLLDTKQHMDSDRISFSLQTEQYVENIVHLSHKF